MPLVAYLAHLELPDVGAVLTRLVLEFAIFVMLVVIAVLGGWHAFLGAVGGSLFAVWMFGVLSGRNTR